MPKPRLTNAIKPLIVPDLSVADTARELRTRRSQVVALLKSGELQGYDISAPGARRKTYRITREALDAFKAGRSAKTPERPKNQKRRLLPAVREFF